MNSDLIIDAPPAIQLHLAAVLVALAMTGVILAAPKGTRWHRLLGRLWVAAMMVAALASFWINTLGFRLGFGPIHALSVLTLISAPYGVIAARRGDIRRHRATMLGLVFGALGVAGLLALAPGRMLWRVMTGG